MNYHHINNCDFVISVSNTTAHLSAGLGKKTFSYQIKIKNLVLEL